MFRRLVFSVGGRQPPAAVRGQWEARARRFPFNALHVTGVAVLHTSYEDILDLTNEEPRWWDENAVPRFIRFKPNHISNIYADECVLFLIRCQDCGQEYRVCMSSDKVARFDQVAYQLGKEEPFYPSLAQLVESRRLHYGDPPNACKKCVAGATMNSVPVRTIEFWRRGDKNNLFQWVQVPELRGVDLWPDWMPKEEFPLEIGNDNDQ